MTADNIRAQKNKAFIMACAYGHFDVVQHLATVLTTDDMRACANQAFYSAYENDHTHIVIYLSTMLKRQ